MAELDVSTKMSNKDLQQLQASCARHDRPPTVGRLYPEIIESHQGGAFDDDLDGLLPVSGAHVALARRAVRADGRVKGDIVGPRDVDTGHAVLVQLRSFGFSGCKQGAQRGLSKSKRRTLGAMSHV